MNKKDRLAAKSAARHDVIIAQDSAAGYYALIAGRDGVGDRGWDVTEYVTPLREILKIEAAATALSLAIGGACDIPPPVAEILWAQHDTIMACAGLLRDRYEKGGGT